MNLENIINEAFEDRAQITPYTASREIKAAVQEALSLLDSGRARVAEKKNGQWVVNQWLKKTVLLSFRITENRIMEGGETKYFDKVEPKFSSFKPEDFSQIGSRIVPPATVRHGAFIGPNVILMPSFVNIGAYVDAGTMVDTWATVGSCDQIGDRKSVV